MLDELRASGYDAYLVKPVRRASLMSQLGLAPEARPAAAGRGETAAPAGRRHRGGPLRILLAEDNEINALLAVSLLRKRGHEVVHVGNGRALLDRLAGEGRDAFDLILMDIHMPELDGLEAARRIRARETAGGLAPERRIPIVALTANAFREDREACLAAGMDHYLAKPIDPDDLAEILERCVAHRP